MTRFNPYLESSAIIDYDTPDLRATATSLADGCTSDVEIARKCFLFVRDDVRHSGDHQLNPVTLKASDVLKYRTGYCYAKSHLLAALLRANGIPTGLCYQRLAKAGEPEIFFLHGLNAVYLKEFGWYRMDARGNRADLLANCTPPVEALPYTPSVPGEADLPEIWAEPLPCIIDVLTRYSDYAAVTANLPDIELAALPAGI